MSQLLQQMMKNRENAGIVAPAVIQSTQHPEKPIARAAGAAAGAGAEPTRKFIIAEKPGKKMVQTYFKLMVERSLEESSSEEE